MQFAWVWRTAAALGILAAAMPARAAGPAATPIPVPPEFQAMATLLDGDLNSFGATLTALGGIPRASLPFCVNFKQMDSNAGTGLLQYLNPTAYQNGPHRYLARLKELGVPAVEVEIGNPLFDPAFHALPGTGTYAQWHALYLQISADIRNLGFKFMVECNTLQPSTDTITAWYQSLTFTAFEDSRVVSIVNIAKTLQPDLIVLGAEPETEQARTKKAVNSPAVYAAMREYVWQGVRAAGITVPLGDGIGTWNSQWAAFANTLAANTHLEYLDIHHYWVNLGYSQHVLDIADIGRAWGKKISMSECWLNKTGDNEIIGMPGFPGSDEMQRRKAFSCWGPLDQKFFQQVASLAFLKGIEFVTPFDDPMFFAEVDYYAVSDPGSWSAVGAALNQAASAAAANDSFTPTALAYAVAIDTTAPTVPGSLAIASAAARSVNLSWDPSADNVLPVPLNYRIYANGVFFGSSAATSFAALNLPPLSQDTFSVQAVDAAGNLSAFSNPASATLPAASGIAPQKFLSPVPADGVNDAAVFGLGAQEVAVYGLKGRKVFQATAAAVPNGQIVWNGRDENGTLVPGGPYLAKIKQIDGVIVYQSFIVVK